jgi:hypothetical protein
LLKWDLVLTAVQQVAARARGRRAMSASLVEPVVLRGRRFATQHRDRDARRRHPDELRAVPYSVDDWVDVRQVDVDQRAHWDRLPSGSGHWTVQIPHGCPTAKSARSSAIGVFNSLRFSTRLSHQAADAGPPCSSWCATYQ